MAQLALDDFNREPATHIISLGQACGTTFNLRRWYHFGETYPFDWWITPYKALIPALEAFSADYIFDPAKLSLRADRSAVEHESGIELTHEFPRVGKRNGPVTEDYQLHIPSARDRSAHKFAKLAELDRAGERLLFVRGGVVDDRLAEVLGRRFAQADWCLYVLSRQPEADLPDDWKGDEAIWDEIIEEMGVRLENPNLKPYSKPTGTPSQVVEETTDGIA